MLTATIQVPNEIVKEHWLTLTYENLKKYIDKENSKNLEKKYYNKEEDNYWPFENSLSAIKFLTRNRWN